MNEQIQINKKNFTGAALCANAIKRELKTAFPNIKFSVRSENFANGNSVHISYIDGVSPEKVEKITNKYQYGHFDGMIDLYEYSNKRDDIPQAKYVSVKREFSEETEKKLMKEVAKKYGIEECEDLSKSFRLFDMWVNFAQLIWREYGQKDVEVLQ